MLREQTDLSDLVESQMSTESRILKNDYKICEGEGEAVEEDSTETIAPIQIRLTKIPFGTRIRQLKDDLISLSCRPLDILWEVSNGSAVLIYSPKQYTKKPLQDMLERLKNLPYPVELLNPLKNPIPQEQIINSSPIPTPIKGRKQPKYRTLKNLSGRPSTKEVRKSHTPKQSRSQVLYQTVTPSKGEVVEVFSQLSLEKDFPPLTEDNNKD